MSIVMWKVLESKVASDEEDVLYRRLEARLERVAQESAVPVGAHWETSPREEGATQSNPVPLPSNPDVKLLAPPADAELELVAEEHEPVQDVVDEPVVAVEEYPSPVPPESTLLSLQPRPAELGIRVTRAVARPRQTPGSAPMRAVTVRPVEQRLSPATARRATVRTTPSS